MIDHNVLLQIDATVIAGVLILLTIGHFRNEPQFRNRTPLSYKYAAVMILPFATSAIFILIDSIYEEFFGLRKDIPIGIRSLESVAAVLGFLYLIVFIFVLAFRKRIENSFDFEIKKHYWFPPEKQYNNSVIYTIIVEVLLRNTSDLDTMINTVNISFVYNDKSYSIDGASYPKEIEMKSGDSKTQQFVFNINENEIQLTGNIKNAKLKIVHTHAFKEKTIPSIKQIN
jgi:hypothetical protein